MSTSVIKLLEQFNKDPQTQALIDKYLKKSFPELFAISRRETSHSAFLSQVFQENSFHNLGTIPMLALLRILTRRSREQDNHTIETKLQNAVLLNTVKLSNVEIDTEVMTRILYARKQGKADIVIHSDIFIPGVPDIKKLTLVIENKVGSEEHDDQTITYYNYFNSIQAQGEIVLYAFLTPLPSIELDNIGNQPECACTKFIQINYQDILDEVLSPMLRMLENNRTHFIIKEYIDSLGVSFEDVDSNKVSKKNKNKKTIIMAISDEDRELLSAFYERNKELIYASIEAISTDHNQDEDVRKDAGSILESIKKLSSRDMTKYLFNGEKYGKGRLVLAVIKDYAAQNHSADDVKENFKIRKRDIIKEKNKLQKSDRYFDKQEDIIAIDNVEYAVDHEWGKGDEFNSFLDKAKELGYKIQPLP